MLERTWKAIHHVMECILYNKTRVPKYSAQRVPPEGMSQTLPVALGPYDHVCAPISKRDISGYSVERVFSLELVCMMALVSHNEG